MANEVHDHFIEVGGVRLYWAGMGEPSAAPPVILLHGLNNSCLSWTQVAPLLAADRRVLMLDLPGHGRSERPKSATSSTGTRASSLDWLEAVGIEQADVVGHSFGGGVAQMLLLNVRSESGASFSSQPAVSAKAWAGRCASRRSRMSSSTSGSPSWHWEHAWRSVMRAGFHARISLRSAGSMHELVRRARCRSVRDVIDWRGQRRNFFHRVHEVERFPPSWCSGATAMLSSPSSTAGSSPRS